MERRGSPWGQELALFCFPFFVPGRMKTFSTDSIAAIGSSSSSQFRDAALITAHVRFGRSGNRTMNSPIWVTWPLLRTEWTTPIHWSAHSISVSGSPKELPPLLPHVWSNGVRSRQQQVWKNSQATAAGWNGEEMQACAIRHYYYMTAAEEALRRAVGWDFCLRSLPAPFAPE